MAYYEGEIAPMGNQNNGVFDWSGILGLIVVAGLFGGGFGFGGNRGNCATQADLAAGFNNSSQLSGLNDIKLAQQQAINYNNQGFAGLNATITNGFSGVDNAVCTLGYNMQTGFNGIANQISSCCCDLKQINLENRYLNEKQTCEIVGAINAGNQRLVDIYNADKMASKDARIAVLESTLASREQTAEILRAVNRDRYPEPAYIVPNPNCYFNPFGFGYGGYGYPHGAQGCYNASVQ